MSPRINAAGVSALSLSRRELALKSGEVVPITNFIDARSDETADPRCAVAVVAGPTRRGKWIAAAVDDAERAEALPL